MSKVVDIVVMMVTDGFGRAVRRDRLMRVQQHVFVSLSNISKGSTKI